jgi:HEAT repeat protein
MECRTEVFRRAAKRDIAGLEDLLLADNPEVRGRTAKALALLGARESAELIALLLEDEHSRIRWDAAMALKHLGWLPTEPEAIACYHVALEHWPEVRRLGELAVPALIRTLEAPWPETCAGASRCLGAFACEEARVLLEAMLFERSAVVRLGAVHGLARLADDSTVDSLIHLLPDESHGVRVAAATLLLELYTGGTVSEASRSKIREQRRRIVQPHYDERYTARRRDPRTGEKRLVVIRDEFGIGLKWPEEEG